MVADGSSKTTVCVEGMHKSCAALTLHTGVLSKLFAIKSCRNPARHIFSWLPGEAVGLHTGVLTKMFAMSVLYLKSELNCGLGTINGEDASKAGGHGSQKSRLPVSPRSVQLARFPVSLFIGGQLARLSVSLRTGLRSHASRSVNQLSTRHLLQPLKPRHVASREWLTEFWIYYNLKTRHLNVLPAINGALVFEIHFHFLHGT